MTENFVVCSKCGTINRLPPSRPAIDAKCGKCKAKVFAAHPEDVDAEIFERQIARSTYGQKIKTARNAGSYSISA